MKTLSTKTYQVWAMENGDTSTLYSRTVLEYTKNGVQQGGSTVGVALSCIFSNNFLVKGTAPAKKKPICAEMTINT